MSFYQSNKFSKSLWLIYAKRYTYYRIFLFIYGKYIILYVSGVPAFQIFCVYNQQSVFHQSPWPFWLFIFFPFVISGSLPILDLSVALLTRWIHVFFVRILVTTLGMLILFSKFLGIPHFIFQGCVSCMVVC